MTRAESQLRNIGIVAHINAGKTTLTERILFDTGKQRVMGEVDHGTATTDYLAEEQRRGISITAAVARVGWKGYRLNLIDTPGHVDFTAEVERCLRVLDGAVVVLDGVKGVESQTEMVWRQADGRRTPRLVFVNKMDREAADFAASVESLGARLACRPVPVVWPVRRAGRLAGLLEVVGGRALWEAGVPAPRDAQEVAQLRALRAAVVEACADFDDSIMADFLDDRPVDAERLHAALRRGTLERRLVPVLGGSALLNRGVDLLLDAVCRYLPSPLDVGPVSSAAAGPGSPMQQRAPRRDEPMCALVFKSVGEGEELVSLARLYSGTLRAGDVVGRGERAEEVEIQALWGPHADRLEPMERALPGDVVALKCRQRLRTGETLFTLGHPMRLEPAHFPRPVLTMAIEPRSHVEAAAVERGVQELAADDPTLVVDRDEDSGRLLVSGMGELHLEVFGSRLRQVVGDRMRFGKPSVAFLETVVGSGRGSAKCRAGGEGSAWAAVTVEVEPAWGGAQVESAVRDRAEAIALAGELRSRLRAGLSGPYPAADLLVRLVEVAGDAAGEEGAVLFLEALTVATRKAMAAAGRRLLEPIMAFAVECPADSLSAVLADLRSRRAQIEGVAAGEGLARVRGEVRLEAMLGYATQLRSLTRGLGTLSLRPRRFGPRAES